MNKWLWLLVVILCWFAGGFAIFAGSQNQRPATEPVLKDVNRIVSMAPNLTEILFALGLGDKIAGTTLFSNYPPQAAKKPKMGTFWQPNIEAIIATKPDLVITLGFNQQKSLAGRLKRIGYKSLAVDIENVNQLFEAIEKIGEATARKYEAEQLQRNIREKLDNLSALVSHKDKVRVLYIVQREPLRVAGKDTFINEIIELAGGKNAIGSTIHKYPPIGAEQIIACGADVIIEPTMGQKDLAKLRNNAVRYWSKFKNVPAVKNNRIYVIEDDTVSQLGPRLYEGTETIARCLRPELFEN